MHLFNSILINLNISTIYSGLKNQTLKSIAKVLSESLSPNEHFAEWQMMFLLHCSFMRMTKRCLEG